MSDSTAPSEGNTDVSGENTDGFKPVTSQEDLDRIIENRLMRERKKFADYDQLKEQASKVDTLQAKLDKAEAKVSEFKERDQIEQWKHDVAKETGLIPNYVINREHWWMDTLCSVYSEASPFGYNSQREQDRDQ